MHFSMLLLVASSLAFSPTLHAQGAVFQTPGMPRTAPPAPPETPEDASQTSRFDRAFNPAFSFVVDAALDYAELDGTDEDGFDLSLRILEAGAQAWVDPHAWAYFIAAADEETLNVEEAAVHFTGLGGNSTLRGGRMFLDFGKQMQTHIHELRTFERPLVLRTFLGEEVPGDGLQWDCWSALGDAGALRWSVGAFASLLPEIEDDGTAAVASVADRKEGEDLNFSARVTAFADVGEHGVLQGGASARFIPNYELGFSPSGAVATGLDDTVLGLDLTYGLADETGLTRWTFGGEFLFDTGDVGGDIVDVGGDGDPTNDTIAVVDDTRTGWFVFADHALDARRSVGLQYSWTELLDGAGSEAKETEAYYTHLFSEFHRLRFSASSYDSDLGDDAVQFALQYTAVVGAHGHGINW